MTIDNTTTVKTPYHREVTVTVNSGGTFLKTQNTLNGKYEQAYLSDDNAKELATALLEAAGETIHTELGELPAVTEDPYGPYLEAGAVSRSLSADPAEVLKTAKALFAIAKELQRRADADKAEEAKKVEEAKAAKLREEVEARDKLQLRRDELVRELTGDLNTQYIYATELSRKAIDKIIELEGKVSKPQRVWV